MDIIGKILQFFGLNKDVNSSALKDGEYKHLKNAIPSSHEGDVPFIQNAPSNLKCASFTKDYSYLGSEFIKEKNFHVVTTVNSKLGKSEIGYFYPDSCTYTPILNQDCLGFNENYPIKITYQYIGCELHIYFQDAFNRNRHINLDNLPYVKVFNTSSGCLETSNVFDCSIINKQNDLTPPIVHPVAMIEAGGLLSGSYQYKTAYANITGDEQSSYYSNTNPFPIYEDPIGGYKNVEGSAPNKLTGKAIVLNFSNLDTRYEYFNLVCIKTVQGTPTPELIATLPISTKEYIHTGRETTKLMSFDKLLGLYPDYYNSVSITSANNYLIEGGMSSKDEANYQRFINLIELEWVVTRLNADTYDGSYKDPLNTVNLKGHPRGEVVPFGAELLLKNGTKSSVLPIIGRQSKPSDLIEYTSAPSGSCDFYEFKETESCETMPDKLYEWQVYDTATIIEWKDETSLDRCFDGIVAYGDMAYWESTDTYPCNEEVWGELAGKPIRHHKLPSASTVYIHNKPYTHSPSGETQAFSNVDSYIYPMGVRLKQPLNYYIQQAIDLGILTQEEASLIEGYEIVRGDRTSQKSIIANGLLYNMRYYLENNPSTGRIEQVRFPNYPYNDLRPDDYLSNKVVEKNGRVDILVASDGADGTYSNGDTIPPNTSPFFNPYPVTFTLDRAIATTDDFYVTYSKTQIYNLFTYKMTFYFYEADIEDFTLTENDVGYEEPENTINYLKDEFTFHSPDTHFKQPFLGNELEIHATEFGVEKGKFEKVEGHPSIKPYISTDSANTFLSFKSESNYNNYVFTEKGNKRRYLEDTAYFVGNNFVKFPNLNTRINNKFRESSVGLKLSCDLEDPAITDESRYTLSSYDGTDVPSQVSDFYHPAVEGLCGCKIQIDRDSSRESFEVDTECTERNRWISSYYATIKRRIPNQYGQIDTIKWVSTGKYNQLYDRNAIFGGDVFITRFALKRKHAFFNIDYIGGNAVGLTYKDKDNILYAKYHIDNEKGGALGEYVVDGSTSHPDCSTSYFTIDSRNNRNGYMYLYSIGVPHFFVESEINTELRYSKSAVIDKWYPVLKGTDFYHWTEQLYANINFDNTYYYNFDYSKQNTEEALFGQAPDFKPNSQCKNSHPRRVVYSKQQLQEVSSDNWLISPANNYIDLDSSLGNIIDVHALDTFKILVRCENGYAVFDTVDKLQLENTSVSVGTGGMFSQRPQTSPDTDVGYGGSLSKNAINVTAFGTFYPGDHKTGKIFHYTDKMEEISNNKMFNWFAENMPFKFEELLSVLKNKENYSKFNRDNPFSNVGYASMFDNKYNLWFLTKKDYVLSNPEFIEDLSFDAEGNLLYKGKLNDFNSSIWKQCGWTISYSPIYKAWMSYHSFLPNYYMEGKESFFSGLKGKEIYKHWDKGTFQTYYGLYYPFEVTITSANEQLVNILQSVEYNLKIQKYEGKYYKDIYENHKINFNKAIISTDNQSSGMLHLFPNDKTYPYEMLKYPKIQTDHVDVLYSKIEGHKYRINQFRDIVRDKNNNIPIFVHDINGVDRTVNNVNYEKINHQALGNQKFRNEFFDVTLINDEPNNKNYKFIFKMLINKILKSDR